MPDKDMLVIWPLYFDSGRSRREGRAVSLNDAIKDPTIDDIITAALKAGMKPDIEREKRHPKNWHESAGRILVPKKGPKSEALKRIARSFKGKRRG
ncbi:MAG: signal recognition particle protein Srp19 [Methanotrichaceae archaeon]|nr:signal recognition particle protein Srp19 [Methanotrichaceae archaeon]